jgi:sporulation protein YlmC with PRC-barrel domain
VRTVIERLPEGLEPGSRAAGGRGRHAFEASACERGDLSRGTSLASGGRMEFTDDALRGRVVLSSDGLVIGEIVRLLIDLSPPGWRVRSFEVRLRKDAAERVGAHRRLFHDARLVISTDLVQSIGDAVILSVSADALRSPTSSEQPAPPPH